MLLLYLILDIIHMKLPPELLSLDNFEFHWTSRAVFNYDENTVLSPNPLLNQTWPQMLQEMIAHFCGLICSSDM